MSKKGRDGQLISHVIYCSCMRYTVEATLSYLSSHGYNISVRTLQRIKNEIQASTHERLNLIASESFLSQHIQRIDTLESIHDQMWSNYHAEKNPAKKNNILVQIAELQDRISAYYDSTRYVMQQAAIIKKKRKVRSDNIEVSSE